MAEKTESSDSDQAKKKLIYSVVILSVAALLLAVFQVLPARFGIDLTGFGKYVGLTRIYETRRQLEIVRNTIDRQESVNIDLPVGEELEFKMYLLEGDRSSTNGPRTRVKYFMSCMANPRASTAPFSMSSAAAQPAKIAIPLPPRSKALMVGIGATTILFPSRLRSQPKANTTRLESKRRRSAESSGP